MCIRDSVYSQGNYIRPADSKPYLVIGEVKYGKPILDRVINPNVSVGDASRCALISMDSTLKSDLTVGPPIDFAVYKSIEKDLTSPSGKMNLNTCKDFEQIASYIGSLNIEHSSPQGINTDNVLLGSTFIVGGQIKGQNQELYLVYSQGNYIRPADSKPYLVIGEVKYGKPILDRAVSYTHLTLPTKRIV